MKTKMLATAVTVMPLLFGGAYAQTVTSSESGNNRSGDGAAMTTNPAPEPTTGVGPDGTPATTPGTSGAATPGTSDTATPGTGTSTAPGAAGATGNMPDATAPGMESRPDATASDRDRQPDAAATTEAITGWSAKDDLMGKSVFNENDDKIGDINDVVISSDGQTMYLLVGAGGFLGMGAKNVAVPFDRFERRDDRILLSGYSKEQLKALPEVRTER